MFRKQATPTQFARFNRFSLIKHLGLAVSCVICFVNLSVVEAADLLYVSLYRDIVTYDISLATADQILNSKKIFARTSYAFDNQGLAFDSDGNLFVASSGNNTIAKFNPNGNGSTFANTNLNKPGGLAFDSFGKLNVVNSGDKNIVKFDSSGNGAVFTNTNMTDPEGIAIDNGGNLYVSSPTANLVAKFDSLGNKTVFETGIGSVGLAFDKLGNLYGADFNNDRIVKWNSSGVAYLFSYAKSNDMPSGLVFDSTGNLYVSNFNAGTISKYNSSGIFQFSWSVGFANPRYLAIRPSSVPEPSTCALGLIAAGAMAWVARRRKGCRNQA